MVNTLRSYFDRRSSVERLGVLLALTTTLAFVGAAEDAPVYAWPVAAPKDVAAADTFAVCKGRLCVVKSTVGATAAKQIAALFDGQIVVFQSFLKGPFKRTTPVTIVVFGHESEYHAYLAKHGDPETGPARPACYAAKLQESLITLRGKGDLRRLSLETAKHELTHHLVHFYTGSDWLPPWFDEGLACFFQYWDASQTRQANLDARLERANRGDFGYFPRLVKKHYRDADFPTAATLFALDYDDFHVADSDREDLYYSASWALIDFLITSPHGNRVLDYICDQYRNNPGPGQPTLDRMMSKESLAALQAAWFRDLGERIVPAAK